MRVCLIGEGTYPVVRGGVSTWYDQLVRGMPDVDFHVTVLTAGRAEAVLDLPGNVRSVAAVDMWGPTPSRRYISGRIRSDFEEAWEVICGHAYGRGGRTPSVTLDAWLVLTRPDVAERLWWLLNDRRSLAILESTRGRSGLEPATGADLTRSMAYVARMILPVGFPSVEADLVHVTSSGSSLLAALPAYAQGAPIVLSEHGVFFRERLMALRATDWSFVQRNLVAAFLKSITKVGYEAATTIAPVSDFNGRWAVALGADPGKVRTVHNGVDTLVFHEVAAEPDAPTIVFVGRIDPLKDLLTLVQAVPHISRAVPDVHLHLIGPVPDTNKQYAEEIRALVDDLGLGNQVAMLGATSDPVAAYCTGTIAVLSSISEGFPYGALEPMACRRAVVATNVGGVPEVVGDAGILVHSRDPDALAEGCIRLLTNPVERRKLAELGRRRVVQYFSLDRMVDGFHYRYADLGTRLEIPDAVPSDRVPEEIDVRDRIGAYVPSARGPEWAYSLIRSKVQG